MKKVFVKAYIENNLGDDLFLYILTHRYPDVRFYATAKKKCSIADNFTVRKYTILHSIINKCLIAISSGRLDISSIMSLNKSVVVTIGGSMFIEREKHLTPKNVPITKKPHYFMGCNFGPYFTNDFLEYHKKLFEKASDVCFRDKKSYRLFSDLGGHIRYAPDIVFSLPVNKTKASEKSNKCVLVSVMDFSLKHTSINQEKYEDAIIEAIRYYTDHGFRVKLMSFCKNEGDDRAIASIIKKSSSDKISYYLYDGDIQKALREIESCDIMVGTRYHANILGMLFNKITIPLVYSDKMTNVLNDIGFNGNYIDLRNDNFDKKLIKAISSEEQSVFDINKVKKLSEGHFRALDSKLSKKYDTRKTAS